MKQRFIGAIAVIILVSVGGLKAQVSKIVVDADKPGIKVSPTLYGVFFEEINRAGDGGIYAEMVQNRSFEDAPTPIAWKLLKEGEADGMMELDGSHPLNTNNPTSLKLRIISARSGRVGIVNEGFKGMCWKREYSDAKRSDREAAEFAARFEAAMEKSTNGIAVEQDKQYRLSLDARCADGFAGPLTVSIEKQDGTVLAKDQIGGIGADWKKHTVMLTANATATNARLVVSASTPGTVWLDMVSLFPKETFKGRENGIRRDLGQMIADMKPAFVRFPGGTFIEGNSMRNAYRWKKTLGDVAERTGLAGFWGYRSTAGLGYHEYLQFCEDIGAEPLFVINCGMSKGENVPMDRMDEYVQDALDAIEYANGPVDSKWGALRTKSGHPAPFNMKMIEIGNEENGKAYEERYAKFHDAIKASYPDIAIIANQHGSRMTNRPVQIVDEHYYWTVDFFLRGARHYDNYDRNKYKVYCGEYAVTKECGEGNLYAALGEAAFMTGMERNSDIVTMSSYAPLLSTSDWRSWNPNAILFDASRVYGSPSYYVQALFGSNRPDVIVPVSVESPVLKNTGEARIGLLTFRSQAEFKDIRVTQGGKTVYAWDAAKGLDGWKTEGGEWNAGNGAITQKGNAKEARAFLEQRLRTDYTLTLKARRTGGTEGFGILFLNRWPKEKTWWILGDPKNGGHVLEGADIPKRSVVPGTIETGRWYEITMEVKSDGAVCSLDGKRIQGAEYGKNDSLYATSGLNAKGDELILKVVNVSAQALETPVILRGVKQVEGKGSVTVMSGNPMDENTFENPRKVVPKTETLTGVTPEFKHTFPAHSISVLRLKIQT